MSTELINQIETLSLRELEDLFAWSSGEYETNPVDVERFVESEEYLGKYFSDEQGNIGKGIYPYWKDTLKEIYPSPFYSPYWLIHFGGSIGTGKSSASLAGVCYELHRLMCTTSPQRTLGLLEATKLVFAIFNVTLGLAQDVVWDQITRMWAESPYFSRLVGDRLKKARRRTDTLFPKHVDFFKGSRIGHSLGRAVIGALLDESNFDVVQDQVYKSFNSLLRRMESRFVGSGQSMGGGGASFPGKVWVVSSETEKLSTVNRILKGYHGKAGVMIRKPSLWDVKPWKYGDKRFFCYIGSDVRPPQIIKEDDPLRKTEPEMVIQVPMEHFDSFEADTPEALKDLAGRPVGSFYKLFRNKQLVNQALIIQPIFPEIITLDFDDETSQLHNHLLVDGFFKDPINQKMPRHIHIDIGVTGDRFGIASSYIRRYMQKETKDYRTNVRVVESVPEVITEWAFAVIPTPGKQVPFFKVRTFIFWMSEQGYVIDTVSADGYQSTDFIQVLTSKGYNSFVLSMD